VNRTRLDYDLSASLIIHKKFPARLLVHGAWRACVCVVGVSYRATSASDFHQTQNFRRSFSQNPRTSRPEAVLQHTKIEKKGISPASETLSRFCYGPALLDTVTSKQSFPTQTALDSAASKLGRPAACGFPPSRSPIPSKARSQTAWSMRTGRTVSLSVLGGPASSSCPFPYPSPRVSTFFMSSSFALFCRVVWSCAVLCLGSAAGCHRKSDEKQRRCLL
jgi:hypothetical protein